MENLTRYLTAYYEISAFYTKNESKSYQKKLKFMKCSDAMSNFMEVFKGVQNLNLSKEKDTLFCVNSTELQNVTLQGSEKDESIDDLHFSTEL